MKFFKISAFIVALLLIAASPGLAQTVPTHTTLTTILTDTRTTNLVVGSTTGMSASGVSANSTFVLVDHELMRVTAVPTSTTLTVIRGVAGITTPHTSGVVVLYGPGNGQFDASTGNTVGVFLANNTAPPAGRCIAANNQYLPVARWNQASNQWNLYNCPNGQWAQQTMPNDTPPTVARYCNVGISGFTLLTTFVIANGTALGTNTTPVAATIYYNTIEIPRTTRITGISMLNGTVASTDNVKYTLHRADGVAVATTLVNNGTAASGIDSFQDIDLTTPYLATGPARYWVSFVTNGTTMRFRTIPIPGSAALSAFTGILGSSALGTFNTAGTQNLNGVGNVAAAANGTTGMPTTLVTGTTPIACVYF